MHSKHITAAFALLAAPALSFAQAQEVPPAPKARAGQAVAQDQKAPHFAAASKLIGMDVLGRATVNGERKDVADVRDFIVDGATGAVTHVIVSSGGVGSLGDTLRRLPFSDLRFDRADPKQPVIWLDKTEAEFDALAKLTKESLDANQSKAIAEAHISNSSRTREANAQAPKDAALAAAPLSFLMLASELDDLDVRAMVGAVDEKDESLAGESLGSVHEAWIDCAAGKVAYLSLEHNKRTVLMPMASLVPSVDADEKSLYLETPLSVAQLASAPAIDEKANLTLDNADFRKSVADYYARFKAEPIGQLSADGRRGRE